MSKHPEGFKAADAADAANQPKPPNPALDPSVTTDPAEESQRRVVNNGDVSDPGNSGTPGENKPA